MMELEIWKDIPGYEGLYQVSDLGNIKSLGRRVLKSNGIYENKSSLILKQSDNGRGYKNVRLSDINGKPKSHYVHRIVALTFIGECEGVVDHIDGIRSNNKLSNLRYLSPRDNTSINKRNKTSKYTGVHLCKRSNKWRACIRIMQKKYPLGNFSCENQAGKAYQQALYNWEKYDINPKGEKLERKKSEVCTSKNKSAKKKNNKIVLDASTGIFYESLKEVHKLLYENSCYKYLSQMISGSRPNKTNLIYV